MVGQFWGRTSDPDRRDPAPGRVIQPDNRERELLRGATGPAGVELQSQDRFLIGAVFVTVVAYVAWVSYELLVAVI